MSLSFFSFRPSICICMYVDLLETLSPFLSSLFLYFRCSFFLSRGGLKMSNELVVLYLLILLCLLHSNIKRPYPKKTITL